MDRTLQFPWQPQSEARGNLAIGNLRENLKRRFTEPGKGVHAPSILAASGAIAGMTAQNAMWKSTDYTPENVPLLRPGQHPPPLFKVYISQTQYMFYGDLLNSYLSPAEGFPRQFHLWGLLAGSLTSQGIAEGTLPDVRGIYRRIAGAVGKPDFGMTSSPPEHRPARPVQSVALSLWPFTRKVFALPPPANLDLRAEPEISEEAWPIISSIVASQILALTRDVVPPVVAVTIIMESAIIASKLDVLTPPRR